MINIDHVQQRQIGLLFGFVAALGAITSILLYKDMKNNHKLQGEIMLLDKELKELELAKAKAKV